jgi:hypothetical protein
MREDFPGFGFNSYRRVNGFKIRGTTLETGDINAIRVTLQEKIAATAPTSFEFNYIHLT